MSVFGAVALLLALVHDFVMPDNPHKPMFWPWGATALAFYGGLDIVAGGVISAWEEITGREEES